MVIVETVARRTSSIESSESSAWNRSFLRSKLALKKYACQLAMISHCFNDLLISFVASGMCIRPP